MSPNSSNTQIVLARTTRRGARRGNLRGSANAVVREAENPGRSPNIPPHRLRVARPFGVAQSYRLTMSHSFTGQFSLTNAHQETTFYVNDPTTAQGFTKMSAFYTKAIVVSSRCNIDYAIINEAYPWIVGLTFTTNSTNLGTAMRAIDDGYCQYRVHTSNPDRGSLSLGVDVRKFANVPSLLSNYDWYSIAAVSPTQQVVGHLWTQDLVGPGGTSAVLAYVASLELDVIFTDPIPFT